MIIVVESVGNHSNQLFQNIHFEAFALDNNLRFYNPTLKRVRKLFIGKPVPISYCLIWIFFKYLNLYKFLTINFTEYFTLNAAPKFECLSGNFALVSGWHFRNESLTTKYKTYFREKYSLSTMKIDEVKRNNEGNYNEIISKVKLFEIVIGLHVRKGDYKEWENGIYYYTDSTYKKAVESLRQLFSTQRVLIVVFSNEETKLDYNEDLILSNNSWFVDHHLMGLCDYLLGPPSTFTMWASYIGPKAKYYHMKDNKDFPSNISVFQECNG